MRVLLSVVAQGFARDADTNVVSLFNILENINGEGFPILVQTFVFFTLFEKEADEPQRYRATFSANLEGKALFTQQFDFDFQGRNRARSFNKVEGLVLPSPGNLEFGLELDNGVRASYAVMINAIEGAAPRVEAKAEPA
jgi:hypothetical protein